MFKVGDEVIMARPLKGYSITQKGCIGTITKIRNKQGAYVKFHTIVNKVYRDYVDYDFEIEMHTLDIYHDEDKGLSPVCKKVRALERRFKESRV